jgi:histidinol-phosphate phosphatase family protein
MGQKAVFIDKDGTLLKNVAYNVDPAAMRWLPGVPEGLYALHKAGFQLFVISNQGGVARGRFKEEALRPVAEKLHRDVAAFGAALAGFYYCPHDPLGRIARYAVVCDCRKPRPGLFRRACRDHAIDPQRSWVIGDILDDVEAGRAVGCRGVLVHNGNETLWSFHPARNPHYIACNFLDAAGAIVQADQRGRAPFSNRRQRHRRLMNERLKDAYPSFKFPALEPSLSIKGDRRRSPW